MSKILAASCKKGLLLLFFAGCVHQKTVLPEDVRVKQNAEGEYLQAYLDASAERDAYKHRIEQYLSLKCRCKHKGVLQ